MRFFTWLFHWPQDILIVLTAVVIAAVTAYRFRNDVFYSEEE